MEDFNLVEINESISKAEQKIATIKELIADFEKCSSTLSKKALYALIKTTTASLTPQINR